MSVELLKRHDAAAIASPIRRQLLNALKQPDSAVNLAKRLGMSRQRVGYHMRELERRGFLEETGQRQRRGCIERLYRAKAVTYVMESGADTDDKHAQDRFSWSALIEMVGRMLRELLTLRRLADAKQQRLATLALQTEVSFADPAQRKAFTEELTAELYRIVEKYHDESSPGSRRYKLCLGAYPSVKPEEKHHAAKRP